LEDRVPRRDIVKIRQSGCCLVITITRPILEATDLKAGDRVMIQVEGKDELRISREA